MIQYVLSPIFMVLPAMLAAQCGMTTDIQVTFFCQFMTITVNTTGGTGPYAIVIEKNGGTCFGWSTAHTYSNDTDGDVLVHPYYGLPWSGSQSARVTVTDALGCTATNNSTVIPPMFNADALFSSTLDCTSGQYRVHVSSIGAEVIRNHYHYQLDNGPILPVSGNWTLQSGLLSNFTVGSGAHTVIFSVPGGTLNNWPCSGTSSQGCTVGGPFTITSPVITPGDCGTNVRVRLALDGALPSGTLMSDALRAGGLIPTTEPYSALGYTYTGFPANASIAPPLLLVTGNDAIVDWVVVELRSTTTTVAYSKPALLQADGDVIDTDGDAYVNVPIAAGNYYVAIRHRNHLGIMTASTRALGVDPSSGTSLIDFRLSSTTTYGTNARVQKGTVWCLWAADATGNGTLSYIGTNNDRDPILTAIGGTTPNNTLGPVYDRRDVNMDGVIKYIGANNDRDPILTNVGSTTPNNTRTQQLP